MSETTPAPTEAKESKETKEGKPGAEAAPAGKAAGPALPLLIGVIVGALAVGGALGALLIGPPLVQARQKSALAARLAEAAAGPHAKKHGKDKKPSGKDGEHGGGEAGKSPVYRIDNVIVNPAGSMGQRFLMCSVAVELEDDHLVEVLRTRDIEVRDVIISTLESNSLVQLTQPGARDSLRHRLAGVLHPLLGEEGEHSHIRVFLPQFVIQ